MSKFNKDSVGGTITVVVLLSLICSLFVAGAAVMLKPAQIVQKQLDKQKNILIAAGLMQEKTDIQAVYQQFIEPKIVDLATGDYVDMPGFDARLAEKDPAQRVEIAPEDDKGGIKLRAKYAEVFLVKNAEGKVNQVIVPMHSRGLWSTIYAFVAVDKDGNTVNGLTYYDQAETAGLGGEIANPLWQRQFQGKQIYDAQNNVAITVRKGGSNDKAHGIDGLSGATITSNAVDNSLKYWFSEQGFSKYLAKFKAEAN